MPSPGPIIGITPNIGVTPKGARRYECGVAYVEAVVRAGGVPVMLTDETALIGRYLDLCDGFLFTGGPDVNTQAFGDPLHPQAKLMDPQRQAFDLALLAAVDRVKPQASVLGVCLGMQLMAVQHGGRLHQHLPDVLGEDAAAAHLDDRPHAVTFDDGRYGTVLSSHHQAVASPGDLRIIARTADGVVEALDAPGRPFYLGVQWHPERGGDASLSEALFAQFVAAASRATMSRARA